VGKASPPLYPLCGKGMTALVSLNDKKSFFKIETEFTRSIAEFLGRTEENSFDSLFYFCLSMILAEAV